MNEMIETIEYRGFNINIYPDEFGESPREWDNLGIMVCFHSRYELGDVQGNDAEEELIKILEEWYKEETIENWLSGDHNSNIDTLFNKLQDHAIVLPLYLYDHSGITMNTTGFSCPWDSGQVGFIYVRIEDVKKEWKWEKLTKKRRQKIINLLIGEVETYDNYLTGNVYGYMIEPKDNQKEIECDDSCWGFYGYDWEKNGLLDHAKPSIDYAIRVEMENFMKCNWAY